MLPASLDNAPIEVHVTPSGRRTVLNSEANRSMLAAAFLADGDDAMTHVMCGFFLEALALDPTTKLFKEAQTVASRLSATYEHFGMPYSMAAALRIRMERPDAFRALVAGPSSRAPPS